MINMSYCALENTAAAISQILDEGLAAQVPSELSEREREAQERLLELSDMLQETIQEALESEE